VDVRATCCVGGVMGVARGAVEVGEVGDKGAVWGQAI
jgi:hypothetical protein